MAWIDECVIGKYKDLFFERFNDLFESGGSACPSWAGWKNRVSGKEVTVVDKTQAARCVSGCVQHIEVYSAERHTISIVQINIWSDG